MFMGAFDKDTSVFTVLSMLSAPVENGQRRPSVCSRRVTELSVVCKPQSLSELCCAGRMENFSLWC